jgi:DNA primase
VSAFRDHVEAVRAVHDIREIVNRYVKLGPMNTAPCPFHKESRPSFSISVTGQYFHCFGCKTSGDIFKFIALMEGKSFFQVVEQLALEAGIPAYRPMPVDQQVVAMEEAVQYATEQVAAHYHRCLQDHPEARAYFVERRRLPEEFLERFMIGWADGKSSNILLRTLGNDWGRVLVEAGLATELTNQESWAGSSYRDLFYDRLVLPIKVREQVRFLTARALDDREPKYMHQRGQEAPLYNEDALGPEVFITEGPFDALSLVAWEFPAVALNGSLRPSVASKFQRIRKAFLVMDHDRAGFQATMMLAAALWPKAVVVPLPKGMDPNDFYLKRTKAEFEDLVAKAKDPVHYALDYLLPIQAKERIAEELEPVFRLLGELEGTLQRGYMEHVIGPRLKLSKEMVALCLAQIQKLASGAVVKCRACGTIQMSRRVT